MRHLKCVPVMFLLLVCFLCFAYPNAATAATQVVTDSATFVTDLAPGFYLENFAGLQTGLQLPTTLSFTGGAGSAFSYQVVDSFSNGLYSIPGASPAELSTYGNGSTLQFVFLQPFNVTAVGGYFFSTNADSEQVPDLVTLLLSDGTTLTLPNSGNTPNNFVGFLSPGVFIQYLYITPTVAGDYATVADFYVGDIASPVGNTPEPATFGLLAGGLIAGGLLRKRLSRV